MKKLQRKQEQTGQKRSSSSSAGDGDKRTLNDKDGESSSSRKVTGVGSPGSSSIGKCFLVISYQCLSVLSRVTLLYALDSSSDELDVSSSPGLMDSNEKGPDAGRSSADDMNPIHKLYSMQDSYFNF